MRTQRLESKQASPRVSLLSGLSRKEKKKRRLSKTSCGSGSESGGVAEEQRPARMAGKGVEAEKTEENNEGVRTDKEKQKLMELENAARSPPTPLPRKYSTKEILLKAGLAGPLSPPGRREKTLGEGMEGEEHDAVA